MMSTLIVMFNLNDKQNPEMYERWAKEQDTPAIKRLVSVQDKRVYRAIGLMGSDAASPYQYVEVIEVSDVNQLLKDLQQDKEAQQLVQYFRSITKDAVFIATEQFS